MRIKKIHITAFGPFTDQELNFAPGMTVISGPNEAGKSTWHAALYAGLCGIRRGKGGIRIEDRTFAELHRPWDGNTWQVSADIELADGRKVGLWHDLDGKVDCRAVDSFGRDVSAEIIFEGSPDGSRWLGLDRRAFLSTACVGQAQIPSLMASHQELQVHLQRAAATAGTDETAASALSMLKLFRQEHVGLEQRNIARPLQMAINSTATAQTRLAAAQAKHGEYLAIAQEFEELDEAASKAECGAHLLEAAHAAKEADDAMSRLVRANDIHARYGEQPAPAPAADEELARQASAAIGAWEGLPALQPLEGACADELRADLEKLPPMPTGDLSPDPAVLAAQADYAAATRVLEQTNDRRPAEPLPVTIAASHDELRDLARDLETEIPVVDPVLEQRHREASDQLGKQAGRGPSWPIVGAGISVAVIGGLAVIAGVLIPGLFSVVIGMALAAIGYFRRSDAKRLDALEQLVTLGAAGRTQLQNVEAIRARRTAAEVRLAQLGLPSDPGVLRKRAGELANTTAQRQALDAWTVSLRDAEARLAEAHGKLLAALQAHGVAAEGDPATLVGSYVRGCAANAQAAEQSGRRTALESQIADRLRLEKEREESRRARAKAEASLTGVASRCGVDEHSSEPQIRGIRNWLAEREARKVDETRELEERAELSSILDGATIEQFTTTVKLKLEHATRLAAGTGEEALAAADLGWDAESAVQEARQRADEARRGANQMAGRLQTLKAQVPSVPGAEEELSRAQAELARVRRLAQTLDFTRDLLTRAQERVHLDIAPVLVATLRHWLPQITGGRYDDALVNPESLEVQVRGNNGPWRIASRLSQGTREQIYLLLRMAMVEHLTAPGECTPLILDDVTVQTDTPRTVALLDLLREISSTRQVILFSQEEDVRAWAERELVAEPSQLHILDATSVAV